MFAYIAAVLADPPTEFVDKEVFKGDEYGGEVVTISLE